MSSPFVYLAQPNQRATEKLVDSQLKALDGLSLAVKDLFHMKGLPTTAGNPTWLLTHAYPEVTNSTVTKLLEEGAIFVGKTITDELAYSLNGQNKHYSTLDNPAASGRIPGGSSSGSAVAVSLLQADIGLGTDTGGSIRVPSSYQGLWGLRTTHNAIPCDNMVPLASSFDTIGWMTRDIDTMLAVTETCLSSAQARSNPLHIDAKTARLGVATHLFETVAHQSQCTPFIDALMKNYNCNALDADELNLVRLKTADTFRVLQGAEIWQQHGEWISAHNPDFANDIKIRFDWCETLSASAINQAKAQQAHIVSHLNTLFTKYDVLVIPTTPGIAPQCDADDETLANDRNALLSLTAIAGLTGLPQLHLPLFTLHNAPCGLSLVGKKDSDIALIKLAKTFLEND
ncbi:amidase [Alteromonas sp. A079]|uniref:amidase n=1 Tax=Alteromonas sp. A079 TaxID=3410268 RepID=UPI003B9F6121